MNPRGEERCDSREPGGLIYGRPDHTEDRIEESHSSDVSQSTSMTLADFCQSLTAAEPPAGLTLALAGLWWDGKGDWNMAHASAQQDEGPQSASFANNTSVAVQQRPAPNAVATRFLLIAVAILVDMSFMF
jgi:hypothetical protein